MEIKYTIEILTKDIQDIEKLVGNLRNSKDQSAIELDLALSKLRNVYEILTMIKADRLHELVSSNPVQEQPSAKTTPPAKPEPVTLQESETKPEIKPEPTPSPEPKPEPTPSPEPEPVDSSILAEKFSAESSINENLAEKRGNDVDSKLMGQPIDNISRNIGINDRFLIIRELFEGDSDQFSNLVGRLDGAENYQSATGILEEQFAGTLDHEGVEILTGLIKRRYIR